MILNLLSENPLLFVAWIVAILMAVSVHEFAHAAMAYYLGDSTAKDAGRLTLNPLAHLDLVGTLLLLFVGFGWGKPVPFNPLNLRDKKWGSTFVSLAGPGANLVCLIFFGLILRFVYPLLGLGIENALFHFLYLLILINTVLMIFNLIPIPPLDGSELLLTILPDSMLEFKMMLRQWGIFILLALVFLGGSILVSLFQFFSSLIDKLFIV
ncbi:MAG: site-2 protease family protein [Parcubacteria group bacterium CG23_combo_of_CG06-09_8_20_14_all_35_9]|nr:MAG: site-2 protease family protein [Parcubacteria group bacterium CG23_combo_of_CG06-09_8_20_14_all_35_9]